MLVNRIRSISGGLCALIAAQAAAGVIVVPGDAASLTEAAQIAEEGDTIYCRGDLLEAEIYVDLDRKRLTLYSGSPSELDEFRTGVNGGLWVLPDGAVLWGNGYEWRGSVRVRDGAEVVAFSTDRFVSEADSFVVGREARVDLTLLSSDPVEFEGPLSLEEGATFTASSAFEAGDFWVHGTVDMSSGSTLIADRLRIPVGGQIIATDATLDLFSFDDQGESLLSMTGGTLRAEELNQWPALVRLAGTQIIVTGQDSNNTALSGDFQMRDSSLLSSEAVSIGEFNDPRPVLERVVLSVPEASFEGDVLFSGEVQGGAFLFGPELTITDDTVFYGFTHNFGLVRVLEGDLQFLGGLDNQGDIVFESGNTRLGHARTLRVLSDLTLRPDSDLVLTAGARLVLGGSLEVRTRTDRGVVSLGGSEVVILPEFLDADRQTVEAMSADLGPTLRGLDAERPDTWPIGTLRIASGVNAEAVNAALNHPGSGAGEALYVHTLVIEAGAELSSDNTRVYYAELVVEGGSLDSEDLFVQIGDCGADLVEPFGTFDLADIIAFVEALGDQRSAADYRAPFGVYDLADVVGFIEATAAGCGG